MDQLFPFFQQHLKKAISTPAKKPQQKNLFLFALTEQNGEAKPLEHVAEWGPLFGYFGWHCFLAYLGEDKGLLSGEPSDGQGQQKWARLSFFKDEVEHTSQDALYIEKFLCCHA